MIFTATIEINTHSKKLDYFLLLNQNTNNLTDQ